jgi:hypothetical protein
MYKKFEFHRQKIAGSDVVSLKQFKEQFVPSTISIAITKENILNLLIKSIISIPNYDKFTDKIKEFFNSQEFKNYIEVDHINSQTKIFFEQFKRAKKKLLDILSKIVLQSSYSRKSQELPALPEITRRQKIINFLRTIKINLENSIPRRDVDYLKKSHKDIDLTFKKIDSRLDIDELLLNIVPEIELLFNEFKKYSTNPNYELGLKHFMVLKKIKKKYSDILETIKKMLKIDREWQNQNDQDRIAAQVLHMEYNDRKDRSIEYSLKLNIRDPESFLEAIKDKPTSPRLKNVIEILNSYCNRFDVFQVSVLHDAILKEKFDEPFNSIIRMIINEIKLLRRNTDRDDRMQKLDYLRGIMNLIKDIVERNVKSDNQHLSRNASTTSIATVSDIEDNLDDILSHQNEIDELIPKDHDSSTTYGSRSSSSTMLKYLKYKQKYLKLKIML